MNCLLRAMEHLTSDLDDYFILNIEERHLPPQFYNTIVKNNDDITVIRSDLTYIKDVTQWVNDFGELTNTRWNFRDSCPHGERFICWEKFVCHHSSFMKVPGTTKRSKSFNCEATLLLKIKLNDSKTRDSDPFLKAGQCAKIIIKNKHSHNLWAGEAPSFLLSRELTKEKFIQYFKNGLGVSESCRYHRYFLKSKGCLEDELISGRINPSRRTVRYWYSQWRQSNIISLNELGDIFEKLMNPSQNIKYQKENLENVTATPTAVFSQTFNSDICSESEEIENTVVSSCLKINSPYIMNFRAEKLKRKISAEFSLLRLLNAKIRKPLEISNYLKSKIQKKMMTQNFFKFKK